MTHQEALVVLNAVPGVGAGKVKLLVEYFGSPDHVLEAAEGDLISSGIVTPTVAQNIVHFSKDKFLEDEYNLVRQKGIRVWTSADDDFPESLRHIPGAPHVLYIHGDSDLLHSGSVAIVGSRVSSYYGTATARRFAASFAQAGVTVVSGLARGIDTAAHQGCLEYKGKTIAVIGCGLNHVYPKENKALMQTIAESGAVVSEMSMTTPPIPANFPRRNRIISGLSLTTVVIEAGLKSGALITADFALEQGKDVFAVPANIDYTTAEGSNKLIKDGAKVALSPGDVLEEFKDQLELVFPQPLTPGISRVSLTEGEMKVFEVLSSDPVHIDALFAAPEVMLNLELKGLIKQLPGKFFVKVNNGN